MIRSPARYRWTTAPASAAGPNIPFYLKGVRASDGLMKGSCPGATYNMSHTCWSNSLLFQDYMHNHLTKHLPGSRDEHTLILYDGHTSHIAPTFIAWAKQKNITLCCLPMLAIYYNHWMLGCLEASNRHTTPTARITCDIMM